MNDFKPPSPRSPYRRRRIIWSLILITLVSLLYLGTHHDVSVGSWSLPTYLKDSGLFTAFRSSDSDAHVGRVRVQEIHGLMHFVTTHSKRRLNEEDGRIQVKGLGSVEVDPQEPVDLRVYAPDGTDAWHNHVKDLRQKYPLIVFSKSYCPYSKRAKALLSTYQISPPPAVIELDSRSDGHIIQAILARLTGRRTVPNVLLHGESIGGSDDVHRMDEEDTLKALLEASGLKVEGV